MKLPVKFAIVTGWPLHTVWLVRPVTVGVGFTVIVKVPDVPVQLLVFGVTVMVLIIWTPVVLVAVKEVILPVPLPPKPMVGALFVQS